MASLDDRIRETVRQLLPTSSKMVEDLPCQLHEELELLKRSSGNHFIKWLIKWVLKYHSMPTGDELTTYVLANTTQSYEWLNFPEEVDHMLTADYFREVELCRRYVIGAPCPRSIIRVRKLMANSGNWGFL
jgi:hypothetical protein